MITPVHVIGGGLAGSEAAWQLVRRGVPVVLHEMRPLRLTEAHKTDRLAELVCSNSLRSDDALNNAVGLLHEELRRAGSLVMRAADCQPSAGRRGAGRRPRGLFRGYHRGAFRRAPHRDRPRRGRRPAACRVGQCDRGHRPAHLRPAGRGNPRTDRRGCAGLLRCHRADRPFRFDRHGHRLVPVALRQGWPRRQRRRLHQLPDGQGRIRRLRRCASFRRAAQASRLGDNPLFRRLPADRGDGRARPRNAAPRADEAGRADQSARPHGEAPCHRPAPPGQCAGHALQHGRLPDAPALRHPGRHPPHDPGPGQRAIRPAWRPPPQHFPQFTQGVGRPSPIEGGPPVALCRPDHRLRRLRRVGRHRPPCRPHGRRRAARRSDRAAAADHRLRRHPRPYHRRAHVGRRRAGKTFLPADERQFRPVPRYRHDTGARQES